MLLFLAACSADPHPWIDTDTGKDDTGSGAARATACVADPEPAAIQSVRTTSDGAVWVLDSSGTVVRYTRGAGDGCSLTGSVVFGDGSAVVVTDLEVDPADVVYADVYFDELHRLDSAGADLGACSHVGAHAVAPTADGATAYVWGVGDTALQVLDLAACTTSTLPLAVALDGVGEVDGDTIVAGAFDPTGDDPPAWRVLRADGSVDAELAATTDELDGPIGVSDLIPTGSGYLLAEPYGGLYGLSTDGTIVDVVEPGALFGDDSVGLVSIGWSATGESYLGSSPAGLWVASL